MLTFFGFRLIAQTDDTGGSVTVARLVTHLDDVRRGVTVFVIGQVALIVAAGLAATMVLTLSRRQEAAATVLGPDRAGAAWFDDPTGRFEQRYWDGDEWTGYVSRDGTQETDPVPP